METMASGSDDDGEFKLRNLFLQWKHLLDHISSVQTRFKELHDHFYSERNSLQTRQREVEEGEKGLEAKVLNFHSEMKSKVLNFHSEMEPKVSNFLSEMESKFQNFQSEMELLGNKQFPSPKITMDLHGTTILIALMIGAVYVGSDSRTTASLNDTEKMTGREVEKVRQILKDPPVLAAFAGNVRAAVEVINELERVARYPGEFTIKRLIKHAYAYATEKQYKYSFEIIICGGNDYTGHHMIFYPIFDHIKGCREPFCRCPYKSAMDCYDMEGGLHCIGSGADSAKLYFEEKYRVMGVEDSIPIGLETEEDFFQALFKAAIKSGGSTGPPFRVDTIIDGNVDSHQRNFIPMYQRHREMREQCEKGYHLFVMYPTVLEGFNRGLVISKDSPIRFDKVIDRGFRLATIMGDTGPYVLQLVKFSMNRHEEKPYALHALDSSQVRTFRGTRKLKSYELLVNLGKEVWKKDLDTRNCNKQWKGIIRAPIFIGKPSLQFFHGLEETYDFKGAETPKHFYSGLREMFFCGSTTGNAGSSSSEVGTSAQGGGDPNITDEDGLKPIQVAAGRGNRSAVEILFPLTSKVESIPKWTVDGILEYVQSETSRQQETVGNFKEHNVSKNSASPKKELPEVTPEAKKKAAEAKSRGTDAFKRKDYQMAIDAYTQAIDLDPTDASLFSNRSLCWMCLGQAENALADGKTSRELKPEWEKAWYREGAALRLLEKFDEAANSFYEGMRRDPENKALVDAFREAVEAGRKFHGADKQKPY